MKKTCIGCDAMIYKMRRNMEIWIAKGRIYIFDKDWSGHNEIKSPYSSAAAAACRMIRLLLSGGQDKHLILKVLTIQSGNQQCN